MKLSLCIITKNEEKNIRNCLKSIEGICDEIIVVDSGSTDKTIEIAKEFTNKIYKTSFNNDFSKLRNLTLEYATGDYILFLDGDEELDKESGYLLKKYLEEHDECHGVYFRISNIIDGKTISTASVFRCFKNLKEFRFERNIHEQVLPSIIKAIKSPNFFDSKLKIFHYGYDPSLYDHNEKSTRNIYLLENFTHEKDSYYYYTYGNELVRVNKMDEAIKCYEYAVELYDFSKVEIFIPYLLLNLQRIYINCNRFEASLCIYDKFKVIFSDFKDFHY